MSQIRWHESVADQLALVTSAARPSREDFPYWLKRAFGATRPSRSAWRGPPRSGPPALRAPPPAARAGHTTGAHASGKTRAPAAAADLTPRHGPQHHSPPSRRPDPRGFARRRPASRALRVAPQAPRWPLATLDPGHRRAKGLAIGSVAGVRTKGCNSSPSQAILLACTALDTRPRR
jgi:hypothetical protein